jgi:hypothetical protein
MTTLKDLDNIVSQINKEATKLYELIGKPIPKYLRKLSNTTDNQNDVKRTLTTE